MEDRFLTAGQCLLDLRESVVNFSAQFAHDADVHAWGDDGADVESFRNASLNASSLLKQILHGYAELKQLDEAIVPKYLTLSEELHRTRQQTETLAKRLKNCEQVAQAYLARRTPVLSTSPGSSGGCGVGVGGVLKRLADRIAELQLVEVMSEDRTDITLFSSTLIIDVGIANGVIDTVRAACSYNMESENGEAALEESKPSPLLFEILREGKVQEFEALVERLCHREAQFTANPGLAGALATLERDLCDTFETERSLYEDDLQYIMTRGHGVIVKQYSSLKLFYYATPAELRQTKDAVPLNSRFCQVVVATRGEKFLRYAPRPALSSQLAALEDYFRLRGYRDGIDVEWKDKSSVLSDTVDLPRSCFLLRLDSPLCLTTSVVETILRLLCGGRRQITDALNSRSWPSYSDLVHLNTRTSPGIPTQVQGTARSHKRARVKHTGSENGQSTVKIACYELPGQTTQAVPISVVPFTHLTHIFPMLQLLRQQLVFNELYVTCSAVPLLYDLDVYTPRHVEALVLPPHRIILEIRQEDVVTSVTVAVGLGGRISVKLNGETDLPKLTAVLRACHSIPAMIGTCLQNGVG